MLLPAKNGMSPISAAEKPRLYVSSASSVSPRYRVNHVSAWWR